MNTFQFILTVLVGAAIVMASGFIIGCVVGKISNYFKAREDAKWDADLFPLPEISHPLSKYNVTRSIEVYTGYLVFKWSNDAHTMTRTHRFKSVKAALAQYEKQFAKQEANFYLTAVKNLESVKNNRELIEALEHKLQAIETKADLIESDLNQLKKDLGDSDV